MFLYIDSFRIHGYILSLYIFKNSQYYLFLSFFLQEYFLNIQEKKFKILICFFKWKSLACFFPRSSIQSWGTYLPGGSSTPIATADKLDTDFCPVNATHWTGPVTCGNLLNINLNMLISKYFYLFFANYFLFSGSSYCSNLSK